MSQPSEHFRQEVQPWIEELPSEYQDVLANAVLLACGQESLAPDVVAHISEAKDLVFYFLEKVKSDE